MDHAASHAASPPAGAAPGAGDHYRELFEHTPVGIYRSTPDGRLLDANPALVRMIGAPSREALFAVNVWDQWLVPDERVQWQARMEKDGVVRDFEFLHRRWDGTAMWVRETARVIYDAVGAVAAYEGIIEDVTERRAAENRLRFQAAVLEGMRESVTASDLDGRLTYWNQASEEVFGWKADEVLGKSVIDLCPAPEHREDARRIVERIAQGEPFAGEFRAQRRGGETFPILLNVAAVRDAAGEIMGTVGIVSDITAQKRAEEVQRFLAEAGTILASSLETESTLASVARLAVPALADWCFVDLVADDGTIHRVASAHVDPALEARAAELARFPRCPHGPTVSARVIRSGRPWFAPEVTDAALRQMSAHPEHLRVLRAMRLLSAIAVPLVARGRTLGVLRFATTQGGRRYTADDVGLAEELARRVAIAVDNARLYQEAQRALQAREQVLHAVSHDLRNPLGAVVAHAEMLAAEPGAPAEERAEWAGIIRRAGEQMTRMIRDLLDASNLQLGRLGIEPGRCCPHSIVKEAVLMLRPQAASRGVALVAEGEGAPAVWADRERVLQVLSNLVANALRFTPDGGRVTVGARELGGGVVGFRVADTGPGVPDDDLEAIFEPFRRGRRAGKDGLGLGLTIARGLVEAHGGRIWAENAPGGGALFHFTLPTAASAAAPAAA